MPVNMTILKRALGIKEVIPPESMTKIFLLGMLLGKSLGMNGTIIPSPEDFEKAVKQSMLKSVGRVIPDTKETLTAAQIDILIQWLIASESNIDNFLDLL